MKNRLRLVFDTNTSVSAICFPRSFGFRALMWAAANGVLLASQETTDELTEVIARPRFDRYAALGDRERAWAELKPLLTIVAITEPVIACRDPKDDKFLSLAVNGDADAIVTRDADLLVLDPFRGVRIIDAQRFLEWVAQGE